VNSARNTKQALQRCSRSIRKTADDKIARAEGGALGLEDIKILAPFSALLGVTVMFGSGIAFALGFGGGMAAPGAFGS
jgi:hypothetical protein